ncbi:Uncharacterized protein Rs2_14104 [Raphanus sativus]|nr:Uncharacterized protein Rs2_14104 [Raphanus sativus]
MAIDATSARIQVSVNIDKPLQFEGQMGFPNGDIGNVTFFYVGFHRYCFTCKRISHDENSCPELTEEQREQKRLQRLAANNSGPHLQLTASAHGHERQYGNKRPRSPSLDQYRKSPPRKIQSNATHDKIRSYSTHKEARGLDPNRSNKPHYQDNSYRRNKQSQTPARREVWSRLDNGHHPPTPSRRHGNFDLRDNLHHRGGDQRHDSATLARTSNQNRGSTDSRQEWRPRETRETRSYTSNRNGGSRNDRVFVPRERNHSSSVTPRTEQEASDSQRTISEHPSNLAITGAQRSGHLIVHKNETEDEKRRRLKGKAIMTYPENAPVSKEKDGTHLATPINRNIITIREPSEISPSLQRTRTRQTEERVQSEQNQAIDGDTNAKDDVPLEDELLDEEQANQMAWTREDEAELSPMRIQNETDEAEGTNHQKSDHQKSGQGANVRKHAATSRSAPEPVSQTMMVDKETAKKKPTSTPEVKGARASKKLSAHRGRASPKKTRGASIPSRSIPQKIPRYEVYPSANSKKLSSLSGSREERKGEGT